MDQTNLQTARQTNSEKVVEINLAELFFLFRQKIWFILIAAVLGGVVAGAYSLFMIAPTYESTAQIYIVSASNDSVVSLSDLQIGSTLTSDYEAALKSRTVTERVKAELNLDSYTVEQLSKMISITNPNDTRFIKITVTTTAAWLSAEIANKLASLSVEWLPTLLACDAPNIVEEAVAATHKAAPSNAKAAVCGALVLAVLVYAFYLIKYLMDDSIRSDEDFEYYFGMSPMASIPEDSGRTVQKKRKISKAAKSKRKGG